MASRSLLDRPALGEDGLSLLQRCLKKASSLSIGFDPDIHVGRDVVGGLHDVPEPAQPATYVRKLRLDGLQPPTLFADQTIELFGYYLRQIADDAFGEDAGANPSDDQLFESAGVEPGGIAATAPTLDQGLTDVVVESAALGVLAREQRLASVALDEPAEHVGACHPPGMGHPGCARAHPGVHPAELSLGDYGGERPLDSNRLGIVSGSGAPDQSP